MDYKWKDHYFEKAKEQGYRSRAAYKLIELDKKFRILRKGDRVVDLGAAPGGWLQVAAKQTGKSGFVWAVDKAEFEFPPKPNVKVICADIEDESARADIIKEIGCKVDAIISDMSPKLSGISDRDNALLYSLAETAFKIALATLKEGGTFAIKLFQSAELKPFRENVKSNFQSVHIYVPKATRRSSSEVYFVGKGFSVI